MDYLIHFNLNAMIVAICGRFVVLVCCSQAEGSEFLHVNKASGPHAAQNQLSWPTYVSANTQL